MRASFTNKDSLPRSRKDKDMAAQGRINKNGFPAGEGGSVSR